jgi:hypothetical protein
MPLFSSWAMGSLRAPTANASVAAVTVTVDAADSGARFAPGAAGRLSEDQFPVLAHEVLAKAVVSLFLY